MAGPEQAHSTLYKIALILEYEGTRYAGFQLQAHQPTIQGELEAALARLTGEALRVHGASRTDAGAHAWGQVVAFALTVQRPLVAFVHGLNAYLPTDIRVQEAHHVPLEFDPRRDAEAREYQYRIWRRSTPSALVGRYTHHLPGPLDIPAMRKAGRLLEGVHDFAAFSAPSGGAATIRRMDRVEVREQEALLTVEMEGNAFLPQQIRRTVGALVQVGQARMTVEEFGEMARKGQPGVAGPALPARGLHLVRVKYRNFPPPSS